MFKNKFRKAMNVSFVLVPMLIFSISIPMFYLSYTTKHANNTKKILQEAAYTGALAGTYAMDINSFELGKENGVTSVNGYPNDAETGGPAAFMIQGSSRDSLRKGTSITDRDCLSGETPGIYSNNATDKAATEIVKAVELYLSQNFKIDTSKDTASKVEDGVYTNGDYSIAMKFERDGLVYPNGKKASGGTTGPFNKVTVSVSLRYKPVMYKSLFKDANGNKTFIPLYGTSSAKTKTIR